MPNTNSHDLEPADASNAEIGLLLATLQEGTRKLRAQLGQIEEDAIIWQPFPNGHSIGAILIHIAGCEAGWLHEVAAGEQSVEDLETKLMGGAAIDQFGGIWPPPPRMPLAWYYAQHDAVRAKTLTLLRDANSSTLQREIPWSPGLSRSIRWMVHHVAEHEAYHMGQAVLLAILRSRLSG